MITMTELLLVTVSWLHILAGGIALLSGYLALAMRKGAIGHRRSGKIFVLAMIIMSLSGAMLAISLDKLLSIVAAALTLYLVITAAVTVRPPAGGSRGLDLVLMLAGLAIGGFALLIGVQALGTETGTIDGQPAQVAMVFGSVALLAAIMDGRGLLAGKPVGARRIIRHLWRMCFALFIAAASFFLGQATLFPEALRHMALLALPVILVLGLMIFWLIRVRYFPQFRASPMKPGT